MSNNGEIKTIKHFAPAEFFVANLVDGAGKESTRIVMRIKGAKKFYFLFPRGAESNMKPAAGWFQEQLEEQAARFIDSPTAPIPVPSVTEVPVGDPAGV